MERVDHPGLEGVRDPTGGGGRGVSIWGSGHGALERNGTGSRLVKACGLKKMDTGSRGMKAWRPGLGLPWLPRG